MNELRGRKSPRIPTSVGPRRRKIRTDATTFPAHDGTNGRDWQESLSTRQNAARSRYARLTVWGKAFERVPERGPVRLSVFSLKRPRHAGRGGVVRVVLLS